MSDPVGSPILNAGIQVIQERSNTPDMLRMVKQRAKQASEYYHHVGLANGNLRRDSGEFGNKRWSGCEERRRGSVELSLPTPMSARSQPSTPVRPSPSRIGGSRAKPGKPDEGEVSFDANMRALTFPRKIRGQDRVRESKSRPSRPSAATVFGANQNKLSDATNFYHQPNSPERQQRNVDDSKKRGEGGVDAKEPRIDVSPSKRVDRDSASDYTIVYTLPNVRPKRLQPRERMHNYETIELPASNDRGSHHIAPKHHSKPNSLASSPSKSPVHQFSCLEGVYGDPNSVMHRSSTVVGRSSAMDTSHMHPVGLKRSKNYTISGTTSSPEKHSIPDLNADGISTPGSRGSPVLIRRLKAKSRSKSEVVADPLLVINQLQDIEGEKDAQKFFAQHFELTAEQARKRRHHFAHYDWQSMLFSFKDVLVAMDTLKRKNAPTGASEAAALAGDSPGSKSSSINGSEEDISVEGEGALHPNRANDLIASCPYFRNEIGGESERMVCVAASSKSVRVRTSNQGDSSTTQAQSVLTNHTYLSIVEHGSKGLLPANSPPSDSVRFGVESRDGGAYYYRTHFYEKEHQNLVGIDETYGPIVISFKREKLEDNSGGSVYQYRIIVRTLELCTLRGSILEDVITLSRHAPNKGHPAKDVVEYVCPEINVACLKVASNPKVQEQIMRVDEHNLQTMYKVGILYCKAGQVTEEDMYNNEHGSAAFDQFLDLIGQKIKLNGFEDFKGGLDVASDSTGTESVFTTFNGYKIMFHVSTLLPFSSTNKQQLLRKRHIGNDIVTIVFQEPGSVPFNPQHMRSHFQHVFIIVRVHNPCTPKACYSVAVTRSRNIPRFGPTIPENSMFPISSTFREFLLTKVINGENTAHYAGKFKSLAVNTREQYLRDLAQNYNSQGPADSSRSFARFSITAASRKMRENKDKQKPKLLPEKLSLGGLTWNVLVNDFSQSEIIDCILGISDCVLSVIERDSRKLIFSMPCQAVLGWSVPPPTQEQLKSYERDIHIYYGRGERLSIRTDDVDSRDEIILRLERFTKGSETVNRQLRRNLLDELGFNVNYEGVVTELEASGCAAEDGVKQSSRLVEICKVSVATMTHSEILDLLRTSNRVTVVIIPPNEDGTPRKCSMELYRLRPVLEVRKAELNSVVAPVYEIDRKRTEPVHKTSSLKEDKRLRNGDETLNPHHEPLAKSHSYHKHPVGKKPSLERKSSGNKTQQTLIATATKLAMVGFAGGLYQQQGCPKDHNDVNSLSSAYNTMSSTKSTSSSQYSGADVDWPEGSQDDILHPGRFLSSDSSLNCNNNSSHSSANSNALSAKEKRRPIVCQRQANKNNNNCNNNNNVSTYPPIPSSSVPTDFTQHLCDRNISYKPDVIYTLDCTGATVQSQKRFVSPTETSLTQPPVDSSQFSHRYDVPSSRRSNALVSQSAIEMSTSSHPKPYDKRSSSRVVGPILKKKVRDRLSSNEGERSSSFDVQSALIKLLTGESPRKNSPSSSNRSPTRSSSQRLSPKRKRSPLFRYSFRSPFRSVSDDTLTTSQLEQSRVNSSMDWSSKDREDVIYSSFPQDQQSYVNSTPSLPLPSTTDWDNILDAANTAEALEASKTSRSTNKFRTVSQAFDCSIKRDSQRTVSEEDVRDHEFSGYHDNELLATSRSEGYRNPRGPSLEQIEKEMRQLQEKLQEERNSKKILEEEVSLLRRDNNRLLQQVRLSNAELRNGSKISARYPIKS